jgi:hypothetical protein
MEHTNSTGGVGRHARKKNFFMKDLEANFLAQEAVEREQVIQKYVTEEDLGVFWT